MTYYYLLNMFGKHCYVVSWLKNFVFDLKVFDQNFYSIINYLTFSADQKK